MKNMREMKKKCGVSTASVCLARSPGVRRGRTRVAGRRVSGGRRLLPAAAVSFTRERKHAMCALTSSTIPLLSPASVQTAEDSVHCVLLHNILPGYLVGDHSGSACCVRERRVPSRW